VNIEKYYEKQKLDVAPGAMSGTLARDMGNQGPVLSKGEPPMNLTNMMRNPGGSKKSPPAVTAPLKRLMRQG
jgi:hypothetical protein